MKKTIYIIILSFSICLNLYLILINYNYPNENNVVKPNNSLENDKFDENCYYMYSNYYLNTDGLDFDLPFVKKCLIQNIFKSPFNLDGMNSKILNDMFNHKSSLSIEYVEPLKSRFDLETQIIDRESVSYALQIINDKDFTKGLIEKSLNGNKKELLFFYLNEYKNLGGDTDYINSILEKINGHLDEYGYDILYDKILKDFSNK